MDRNGGGPSFNKFRMSGGDNRLGPSFNQFRMSGGGSRVGPSFNKFRMSGKATGDKPAQYTDFFSLVILPVIRKITRSAMLVARSAMRSRSWAAHSR